MDLVIFIVMSLKIEKGSLYSTHFNHQTLKLINQLHTKHKKINTQHNIIDITPKMTFLRLIN